MKDIFEDIKRHQSDAVENGKPILRADMKTGDFKDEAWRDLKVGQVVKVNQDQYFPADLILLKSSADNCLAYVETKNLDGETNLKHKAALKDIQFMITTPGAAAVMQAEMTCEAPNTHLYKFDGFLKFDTGDEYNLDHNQLLLRGCSLKNTEWVYGLVVYTGHDTKIMMNSSKSRNKFSKIELITNRQIILVFLFQILICIVGATLSEIWTLTKGTKANSYLYLQEEQVTDNTDLIYQSILIFGTWMLMFANLVPISLIVTMEMVKFM